MIEISKFRLGRLSEGIEAEAKRRDQSVTATCLAMIQRGLDDRAKDRIIEGAAVLGRRALADNDYDDAMEQFGLILEVLGCGEKGKRSGSGDDLGRYLEVEAGPG